MLRELFKSLTSSWERPYFLVGLVVLSVVLYGLAIVIVLGPSDVLHALTTENAVSVSDLGSFGDSFSVLTCLFSGLAFAGVLMSLTAQRAEMREMRVQMRLDRATQLLMLLMEKFIEVRREITVRTKAGAELRGDKAVSHLQMGLFEEFAQAKSSRPADESPLELLREITRGGGVSSIVTSIHLQLGQYLRLIVAMIELLSDVPDEDRERFRVVSESVFSTHDFFLVHHWFLVTKDRDFLDKIERVKFFSPIGAILAMVLMKGGPYHSPEAYGSTADVWEKLAVKQAEIEVRG